MEDRGRARSRRGVSPSSSPPPHPSFFSPFRSEPSSHLASAAVGEESCPGSLRGPAGALAGQPGGGGGSRDVVGAMCRGSGAAGKAAGTGPTPRSVCVGGWGRNGTQRGLRLRGGRKAGSGGASAAPSAMAEARSAASLGRSPGSPPPRTARLHGVTEGLGEGSPSAAFAPGRGAEVPTGA